MSEKAEDNKKQEEVVKKDDASLFASFTSFILVVVRIAVEINIVLLSCKLCGVVGAILACLAISVGKNAYTNSKIPDSDILASIDAKEYDRKVAEITPDIVMMLLVVMVVFRMVVISVS